MTLKLVGVTADAVDVGIVQDKESLKKAVQSFADGYNALAKLIADQTKYDAATKSGGPLQGDSSAVGIQRQLRLIAGSNSAASTTFTRLSDIGLSVGPDGQMAVTASKLDNALANPAELKKMLSNADTLGHQQGRHRTCLPQPRRRLPEVRRPADDTRPKACAAGSTRTRTSRTA